MCDEFMRHTPEVLRPDGLTFSTGGLVNGVLVPHSTFDVSCSGITL
jgi:hypothetical protein